MTEDNQIFEEANEIDGLEDEYVTFTLKRSQITLIVGIVTFVLGIGLGYLVWGASLFAVGGQAVAVSDDVLEVAQADPTADEEVSQPEAPVEPAQNEIPDDIPRYDVPVDDDPVLGSSDAPITIIEFSDYQCPYCTKFHVEVFSRLIEEYGDQIQFVYRDFPLTSIHGEAFPAAEAANCAREQNVFWEYHDKLFQGGPQMLSSESYLRYAEELELDLEAFQECVDSRRYQDEVQADLDYAVGLGVRSTPTFFVNGIAVVGAQPFEVFQQIIESELGN